MGDIARENVKATGEFLVEDVETTAKRQQELLAQTPPVFDLEEQMADKVQQRLQKAMDYMRRLSQENAAAAQRPAAGRQGAKPNRPCPHKVLLEHKAEFDQLLGVTIPNPTFQLLAKAEFLPLPGGHDQPGLEPIFQSGGDQQPRHPAAAAQGDPGAAPAFQEGDAGAAALLLSGDWTRGANPRRVIAGSGGGGSPRRIVGWCAT